MTLGEWGKKANTFIKNHKDKLKKAAQASFIVNVGTGIERIYPVSITMIINDEIVTVHTYMNTNEVAKVTSYRSISFEVED